MRCVCKTKDGTQCKKTAEEGSKKCYIHARGKCAKAKAPRKVVPKSRGKAKASKVAKKRFSFLHRGNALSRVGEIQSMGIAGARVDERR